MLQAVGVVARPTKYNVELTPKLAYWMAHAGLTDIQMAEELGVNEDTIYEWKKVHPAFSEALKSGKETPDAQVESALLKKALGYEYDEYHGKLGEMRKVQHPDTVACIFWLKNRQPDQWRDVKDINQGMTKEVQAKLTALLSEAVKANLSAGDADKLMAWFEERVGVEA